MTQLHPYTDRRAVLTSLHKKSLLIAPIFSSLVGLAIEEVALNTDQLGTFSGEIERTHSPLDTAILKARLGMQHSGLPIGIASEGSIGTDPVVPFVISDIELLVLIDDEKDIIITEIYRSLDIRAREITCVPGQNIESFLYEVDFPNHHLIVKSNESVTPTYFKGIADKAELVGAIRCCASESRTGSVTIQTDLRANHCPSRQRNIINVAQLLAKRVNQLCPQCQSPGWGKIGYVHELPCSMCLRVVDKALRAEIFGCVKCDYQFTGESLAERADPSICDWCNP